MQGRGKNKDSPKWHTRLNISYLELQLVTILLYNKKKFWNVSFKRELFEVLQKHQSSVINSFIFNYSVRMNWWKHAFNALWHPHKVVGGTFLKEEISMFHIWNFESHKSLWRKFFLNPLRQHNLLEFSYFCSYWCCSSL